MPVLDRSRKLRIAQFDSIVGFNVRRWREGQRISQAKLAAEADMSQSQLARIEQGERSLSLKQALVICDSLDIDIDTLTA